MKRLSPYKKKLEHTVKQKREIQESFQVSVQELKQNFKEKETKLEHDFSKIKDLKDKIEDKLYRQYNSIQAFNHIISHKRFSDVHAKNIIGDSFPTKSEKALEAQTALYDGNEMLKPMHAPPSVVTTDEIVQIEDVNRNRMEEKLNDSKSLEKRVIVKPPNYDKENFESIYRSTLSKFKSRFKPQTNLTPE